MAKEKRRNYDEKSKGEMLSEETRNALFGILVFLVAVIGLVETAGPLGKIIRYVFVYLLGTYSSLVLLAVSLIGIYIFVKRKFPKIKINLVFGAVLALIFFSLIYSSKNDWTLENLMSNYRDVFDSVSQEGYVTIISSAIAGGFIGHLFYTLLASFVGGVGVQIICIVFMIASLLVILNPIIYWIGNKLVNLTTKIDQDRKNKKRDEEVKPSIVYNVDGEVDVVKPRTGFQFVEDIIETPEEPKPVSKPKPKEKHVNSFDIFNNEYNFGMPMNEHHEDKPRPYDIFNDTLFDSYDDIRRDRIDISTVTTEPTQTQVSSFGYQTEEPTQTNTVDTQETVVEDTTTISSYYEPTQTSEEITPRVEPQPTTIEKPSVDPVTPINSTPATPFIFKEEVREDVIQAVTSTPTIEEKEEPSTPEVSNPTTVEEVKLTEEVKPSQPEKKPIVKPFKNFMLPSLALLDEPVNHQEAENRANAERKGALLNKKLESLGIKARVVNYRISASFTRFEISLDPNSKITLFNNIAQDLMMALSAQKVNVLAPIPGSEFIGVEIPNAVRSSVSLKETLVGTITYATPPLLTAIGKDAIGEIISFDLAKTPHLLVAGSTGSGKSVCMNAIIMSLLMHNTPNDLKLILIDPKRVEFSAYANIPHLACPVITDVGKAGMALTRLVEFMNDRYKILENIGAKNIEVYNKMMEKQGKDKMEYYVCIVDELADLFMNVKSAENSIKEITQLSRAVGIHMIVATQRPSVDVITGTIKNNIPSRIAFAVTTGADSRTILDAVGAENLLGKGDMLVNITGRLSMSRGQGCNVTDDEIERVVDFIKKQGNPVFNPRFLDLDPPKPQPEEISTSGTPEDDLINEIIAYMSMGNHVSTTKIQTKFNIGYPRAARIIERLAEANIIYRDPQTKQWALNENRLETEE